MPYTHPNAGLYAIPNWEKVHPELHPRWISVDAKRFTMHQMSFGDFPGYKIYGADCSSLEELQEKVEALGLPATYVNTNTYRVQLGDTVLAYIPREEYERRLVEKLNAVRQRSEAEIDSYLASQRRRGVTPIVMSEDEFNDKKNFHSRDSNNRVGYTGAGSR